MLTNSIPNYSRAVDSSIPKQVLESKLKNIDKRRAEIELYLTHVNPDSYHAQEIKAEYAALGNLRAEVDGALNPRPKAEPHPTLAKAYAEDRARALVQLRSAIKQQTQQTEHAAEKEEAAGNHRQAKILRLTIPEIPERVAKEFGADLSLLTEISE